MNVSGDITEVFGTGAFHRSLWFIHARFGYGLKHWEQWWGSADTFILDIFCQNPNLQPSVPLKDNHHNFNTFLDANIAEDQRSCNYDNEEDSQVGLQRNIVCDQGSSLASIPLCSDSHLLQWPALPFSAFPHFLMSYHALGNNLKLNIFVYPNPLHPS